MAPQPPAFTDPAVHPNVGRARWLIVAVLFAATAINYVDRQMIGLLKPTLQGEFRWSEATYAEIVFFFQLSYAIGLLVFGAVIDRIGARLGYAGAFVVWTTAHILHGAVNSVAGFGMARALLGVGESGNFPAGIKAVSEWFPRRERAFATGLFNAGANVGAIITPLVVPAITLAFGWRMAFVITGVASSVWLVAWLAIYRSPRHSRRVSPSELALIESDPHDPVARVPWLELLRLRETWAIAGAKFLTDPVWYLFLFWLPDFLSKRHGLDLKTFGPPLIAIYVLADVGSISGGWLSSRLLHRGWSVNAARKTTMLLCAIAVIPIVLAQWVDGLWTVVAIIGLAAAAHQAWSANVLTLASDMFPRSAVASVTGIVSMAGAVGGMLFSLYVGQVLERIGTYTPVFVVAGSTYLVALLFVHLMSPRLAPIPALPHPAADES